MAVAVELAQKQRHLPMPQRDIVPQLALRRVRKLDLIEQFVSQNIRRIAPARHNIVEFALGQQRAPADR